VTDFAILPLLPTLAGLGVMACALFLAATALSTHRLRKQRSGATLRETACVAMFGLAWAGSGLPLLLANSPTVPVHLSDLGWTLALAATWLLPSLAARRIDLLWRVALTGCVLGIVAVGGVWAWGLPLFSAGTLLLVRARLDSDLRRWICTASGLLFLLAGIASHMRHVAVGQLPQALVLAALVVRLWWCAGLSRRLLIQLVAGLLLFPVLLTVSGRIVVGNEAEFRADLLQQAYARLELTKSRIEIMDKHGFDLLKVATADPIALEAVLRPVQNHDLQFRILNRRIGADVTFLLDTRGQVIATSDPALNGRDFAYRPYFQAAFRGDASQYLARSATTGLPRVYYARPILNEAAVVSAVMVAAFNLGSLIGDNVRMDEVILHQQGVILYGPEPHAQGALFPPGEFAVRLAKERLFGPPDFAHLGFQKIDEQWVRDATGQFWLWASVPLPNGVWEVSKMVSIASLLRFREGQLSLVTLFISILLLLGIHHLQSSTFVAQLLREVDKRRSAEEAERIVRREAELQRDHLDETVQARTHDLAVAKDAAEAASRAKSEFLATMSHEIRTPMNGVLGMTDLLRHTALSAQQQRYADAVYQSGEHLLSIINDILDFSKIEAGKLELEHVNFNLRQLVEDLSCLFAQPAAAKGVEVICSIPYDLPVAVSGDPMRMRQILTNLVNNAVKFTSRGEILIGVTMLDDNTRQARYRFEVQDSGIGISEEAKARLFNAFVQADSSTTRRFGGSGLGLAIAKCLVEMMHGQLDLHSEVGRGTLFWFEIPLLKQDSDARSVLNMAQHLSGLRVLVVDDNATSREILACQLHGWSMHCTGVADGQQALQVLQQTAVRPFDLAILDLHMPGMDGFALARAIRSDARWAAMPIILSSVSACADHPDRRDSPIDYYLSKPVRQSDLHDVIDTATSRRASSPDGAPVASVPAAVAEPVGLGGRVLVAEDNPVNQAVAGGMLESLGVAYSLVDNGVIALDRVLHEAFDLVLMDCQMPEMDGFEATAQIRARQREGLLRQPLPIVALTANAIEGDRERCLAAGMDDYLSKPFTHEQLAATLQRWMPRVEPKESQSNVLAQRREECNAP
jgi:signal transduction histidine kinase/CheY-like chemotaxis protein